MASGTKGRIKAIKAEKQRLAYAQRLKAKMLKENRDAVKLAVCSALGWSKLEPFAENMIDTALNGGLVDIKQLVDDLAEWQKTQNNLEITEE